MTVDERFAIAIGVMAAIAFGCRATGLLIGTFIGENPRLRRLLDILPTCAIGAVIGPSLSGVSFLQAVALTVAAVIFVFSTRFLIALLAGTAVLLSSALLQSV
ncbi:MAG: AzlD domain-containing protein [Pseudomonadota bacterium]